MHQPVVQSTLPCSSISFVVVVFDLISPSSLFGSPGGSTYDKVCYRQQFRLPENTMSSAPVPIISVNDQPPVWGWVRVRALVIDSVSSPHSRRAYATALDDFRRWSEGSPRRSISRESVQQYRRHLESRAMSASAVNLHLTVIRKLAREAAAN